MSDPSILLIPPLPANCCRLLQTLSDRQGVLSCSEWPVDRAVNICLTYNLIRLRSVVGVRESDRKAKVGCWVLTAQGSRVLVDRELREKLDPPPNGNSMSSPKDLAERFGLPAESLRKILRAVAK